MAEVKSPQTIYLVAHQQYQCWSSSRFDVADIGYYHYAYVERLRAVNAELVDALKEIAKGEGAFSLDPLTFASNTIENMKGIAQAALANADPAQ